MKKQIAFFLTLLLLLIPACIPVPTVFSPPTPTPAYIYTDGVLITTTPNPTQLYQSAISADITRQAAEQAVFVAQQTSESYNGRQTATAIIIQQTATQMAYDDNRIATAAAATATHQVWQATAAAAAVQSTATAVYQSTANSATQAAVSGIATLQADQIMFARTAQARADYYEELTGTVKSIMPVAMIAAGALLLIWLTAVLALAYSRKPIIVQRDDRGDAPLLVFGRQIADADRQPGALLETGKHPRAELIYPEVTQRDQTIDMAHRGSGQARPAAYQNNFQNTLPLPIQPYRIYRERPPELPGATIDVLDAEWRET